MDAMAVGWNTASAVVDGVDRRPYAKAFLEHQYGAEGGVVPSVVACSRDVPYSEGSSANPMCPGGC